MGSNEVGQPLDSLGRKLRQRRSDAAPRDHPVRRDFRERHQHEGAFEQAGVRQRQLRLLNRNIVIGDQIEVERARAPASFVGAVAAEFGLDLVQREQQRVGSRPVSISMQALMKFACCSSPQGGVA